MRDKLKIDELPLIILNLAKDGDFDNKLVLDFEPDLYDFTEDEEKLLSSS